LSIGCVTVTFCFCALLQFASVTDDYGHMYFL
jgi:hypothetical protein